MDILKVIKEFLEEPDRTSMPIYKSDLRDYAGIDPKTAEDFFRIIEFCQQEIPAISISLPPPPPDEGAENFLVYKLKKSKPITWHVNPTKTPRQPPRPLLVLKFRCACGEETVYPEHCGEHMEYDFESKKLRCRFCQTTAPIPIHHDEEMKVVVQKLDNQPK